MALIIILLFALFVVALELRTGVAVLGWPGNGRAAARRKNPGPYWIAITLHMLAGIGLPILIWYRVVQARQAEERLRERIRRIRNQPEEN